MMRSYSVLPSRRVLRNSGALATASLLLIAPACSNEDPETASSAEREVVCDAATMEGDMSFAGPMVGPAVDPATGALTAVPSEGYVVSSTYLRLRPEPEAQSRFAELLGPMRTDLASRPGLLALQFGSSAACGTGRTFSVWANEDAMYAFVVSEAHLAAMASVGEVSRGGSQVTHWTATRGEQVTWEYAARQVAAVEGPGY